MGGATLGGAAGIVAGIAAGVAAVPLTAIAAVGAATGLALTAFTYAPTFYCQALFYKKCLFHKVVMSLAVLQDLPSSNELLQVHPAAQALGDFDTSFRFTFSKRKDHLLKVTDIPSENKNGWRFTLCNTDAITQGHVADYNSGKSGQLPYIQLSVEPDETDATNKLSHALSIDGIETPSVAHWRIEVSKNEISSLVPSSASATTAVQTGAQASPSVSTDQQVQQSSFDPQLSVTAFRKQFEALSKLLSVSFNRLAVAPALFGEGLITFDCYKNATEGSSKTEEEKSTGLMISLMSTISTQPELLTELINVLKRIEPFKLIATKLAEASSH
ncbi:PREDICTED: uncharacterized protein LOC109589976 [Amphimedon queenslandica]|nr:PREDICTED: uncharacterized protein LOC109589976 [Amphimedon queenslandica]|eukprot:XP_019861503.1 PREDICTED: uncharacterized protein LOC109589976 [Amphimedon queenslandica]